ncbi:peptidoglycan editing factor PgeF [Cyanobium sp. Morenito 9A2]|uniref:peptidoglycan editing factor PgeF n=1 Tax=Cyanobium sp. Morenito 9A2 TaxID=2823718 RepID=UPI0020CF44F8|nr:peptidoglycan editing factor PgeF [Cyanobium sp. Morenito 9A2]MCP9849308.1 peptidoglycan editing factor PgeF [Cyanobium sp. Morenito 9A2]
MAEAIDPPFDRPDVGFNALEGWSWIGCYGGYYLQCDRLAEFEHGFFTRQWSGRGPEVLAGVISAGVSVHRPSQIHGAVVLPASQAPSAPWPEADGLVSDQGGQSLWVCGADCPPVLIADPASGRVAACHAGWRGMAARILPAAIEQLVRSGSLREHLQVALGPAISGTNYQVERRVSEQVALALGGDDLSERFAALEAVSAIVPDGEPGRDRLDLRLAIRLQLEREGITADAISACPLCTFEEPLLFHSWRRDQVKAVQWSGIVAQS